MWKTFWQLAKLEGSGSYLELFNAYNMRTGSGGHIIDSAPLSFVRIGWYSTLYGHKPTLVGEYGYSRESKAAGATQIRSLFFASTGLSPQDSNTYKGDGLPIRCVVR